MTTRFLERWNEKLYKVAWANLDMQQNLWRRVVLLLISIDNVFLIVFALLHEFYCISSAAEMSGDSASKTPTRPVSNSVKNNLI